MIELSFSFFIALVLSGAILFVFIILVLIDACKERLTRISDAEVRAAEAERRAEIAEDRFVTIRALLDHFGDEDEGAER